jgi:hypothetical protein
MQYKFIHHWQYEQTEEERNILEQAVELANEEKNDDYLFRVATFLAQHTGTTYVLIGLLQEDKQHIESCIFLRNKKVLPNIVYGLQGTPCEAVVNQGFCFYPFKVAQEFPRDKDLQVLNIESYLGTMLFSGAEEPIGLVALMDTQPMKNAAFMEHLILVLSLAIEETLEKKQAVAAANQA